MAELKGGTTIGGNIVWHAGNMGHNNGLDADTLDGKHASDFISNGGGSSATMASKLTISSGGLEVDGTDGILVRDATLSGGILIDVIGGHIQVVNGGIEADQNITTVGGKFISMVDDGTTPPLEVWSNVMVTNLNADLLDGNHASAFATSGHNHDTVYAKNTFKSVKGLASDGTTSRGQADADTLTDVLTLKEGSGMLFAVDAATDTVTIGLSSTANADTVDGLHASDLAVVGHNHDTIYSKETFKSIKGLASDGTTVRGQVDADTLTDVFTLKEGTNIGLSVDATTDTITIALLGTVANATNATNAGNADTVDSKHASDFILKAGGTMTGQLVLLQGASGGIAFPNDSFGGAGGDTCSITLQNPAGGEAQELTIQLANDADDVIHMKVPSANGVKINGNVVWHAGNANFVALSTTAVAGSFDKTATAPTGTTRLNYGGYFYATRTYNAVYNDYAEYFLKDCDLDAGDVIIKNTNGTGYVKSNKEYDKLVVGVYSDDYAQCIGGNGDEHDAENFAPVGMAGRVNVKVIGNVEIGDLLVSSSVEGVAMASVNYIPGTVIGKALQTHSGDNIDKIKMLIMNC